MPQALVVDDEPLIADQIRDVLEEEGFGVRTAVCGEEALEICEHARFDVVFLDVCMPGLSGLDVARELRARPDTSRIPLVFCTVMDAEEDLFDGFECGGNAYVVKPFDRVRLVEAVRILRSEAGVGA